MTTTHSPKLSRYFVNFLQWLFGFAYTLTKLSHSEMLIIPRFNGNQVNTRQNELGIFSLVF